jgi:hypothetical protein
MLPRIEEDRPRRSHEVDAAEQGQRAIDYVVALHVLADGEELTSEQAEELEIENGNADPEGTGDGYGAALDLLNGWALEVECWSLPVESDSRAVELLLTCGGPTVRLKYDSGYPDEVIYRHSWGSPAQLVVLPLNWEERQAMKWLLETLHPEL